MAIFNMRRVFEDDTSTDSIIYSPDGEPLCCALELGPNKRMPEGLQKVSDMNFGPYDSQAAVKIGWNIIKGPNDTAYRIPKPEEVLDAQRPHEEAWAMLQKIMGPDDQIRIVHA